MAESSVPYILLDLDIDEVGVTPLIKPSYLLTLSSSSSYVPHGKQITGKNYVLYKEQQDIELYLPENFTPNAYNYILVNPIAGSGGNLDSAMKYLYRIDGYDPTGKVEKTADNKPVRRLVIFHCTLDYMASMHFSAGNNGTYTLYGRWSRTPIPTILEPFQIRPAQMMRSKTVDLPINVTQVCVDHSNPQQTSTFCLYVSINYVDSGVFKTVSVFACDDAMQIQGNAGLINGYNSGDICLYPNIPDIINHPEYLGITASTIVSISISPRTPFYCERIAGLNMICSAPYTPIKVEKLGNPSGQVYYCGYRLNSTTEQMSGYVSLTDKERLMGQVRIYDVNGNIVGSIDTRYAVWDSVNSEWRINYTIHTVDNMNNLFTTLTLSDGTEITFPEGTVPYNGSRYQEYAVAELSYDRELLAMNQEKVVADAALGISGSLINGAFIAIASGGAGAGAAATGVAGAGINAWLSYEQNKRGQEAKEQLMKDTPDSLYTNGYGTAYWKRFARTKSPGFIAVNMPYNVGDDELTAYTKEHGYPVTDLYLYLQNTDLPTEGFMQANKLTDLTVGTSGVKTAFMIRGLDKQLRQGIRFRTIT